MTNVNNLIMPITRRKNLFIVGALGVLAIGACVMFWMQEYRRWQKRQMVAMLRRSVDEWNWWRKENKEAEIDLSGADLSGAHLFDANLRGAQGVPVLDMDDILPKCFRLEVLGPPDAGPGPSRRAPPRVGEETGSQSKCPRGQRAHPAEDDGQGGATKRIVRSFVGGVGGWEGLALHRSLHSGAVCRPAWQLLV